MQSLTAFPKTILQSSVSFVTLTDLYREGRRNSWLSGAIITTRSWTRSKAAEIWAAPNWNGTHTCCIDSIVEKSPLSSRRSRSSFPSGRLPHEQLKPHHSSPHSALTSIVNTTKGAKCKFDSHLFNYPQTLLSRLHINFPCEKVVHFSILLKRVLVTEIIFFKIYRCISMNLNVVTCNLFQKVKLLYILDSLHVK